ncbi:hypothetical protein RFI_19289, partial [Reticulomyxa filosa]
MFQLDTAVVQQMQMELTYATTCETCQNTRPSTQTSRVLALDATDVKSLNEGLDKFVEIERLHGDNAVDCGVCQSKQNSQRQQSIKKPPKILLINLKRIRFDLQRQVREKLNHYISFPDQLDIRKYLTSYWNGDEADTFDSKESDDHYSSDATASYWYDLVGVIIHSGSATKDRPTKRWFKFNDTKVEEFDFANIQDEAFGGELKMNLDEQANKKGQNSKSAKKSASSNDTSSN